MASLSLRASTLGLSAGAHAMIAFAAFGQPGQGTIAALDPLVSVDAVTVEEASPAERPGAIDGTARSMAPTGHTRSHSVEPDHNARPREPSAVHPPSVPGPPAVPSASAPTAEAPAATTPRFSMRIGTNDAPAENGHALAGSVGGDATLDPSGAPFPEAGVSVPARLLGSASPAYPAAARLAEVEADVALEIVVSDDGRVLDARVVRRTGYGVDEEALRFVRAARFSPALRGGRRVPVRMRWTVSFRLR